MSKLKPKYNFLIFIFLILTFVFTIDGVKAVDYSSEYDAGPYISYSYSYLINYDDVSSLVNEGNYTQEDVIYNLFQIFMEKSGLNYNFSDYLNVEVELRNSGVQEKYNFHFSTMDFYNVNDQVYGTKGDTIEIVIDKYYQEIHFYYNVPDNSDDDPYYFFSARVYAGSRASTSTNITGISKQLNFEGYDSQFDENLFKDNPNFKQVCVDKYDLIAITRTNNPENLEYMTDYDYIWFPYEITGIKNYNYHNADLINDPSSDLYLDIEWSSDHIYEFDNSVSTFYANKLVIDSVFDDEIKGANLEFKGYTDRYSYYGWTSDLFHVWFDYRDGNDFNFFAIYEFQDAMKSSIPIENNDKICFYIKNEYSVTKVYKDEFDDVYGNVPTQNGDFNFTTSLNKDNVSSGGMMSQVNKFISQISDDINFIKDNVYLFYSSLPLIVRMFITSVIVILIVKFIIGMVVR